jgi:peptidoglycan hydrolase-like protein with peptidoglycan-binding domain
MPEIRPFTFPSTIGLSEGVTGLDVEKLQKFLQHFGYLRIASANEDFSAIRAAANPPNANLGNFDEATARALRAFQQFHGLPVTGVLDEATVVQMSRPRCGFPDIPTQQGVSDFLAQGNRWDRTDLTYGFQELTPELTQQQIRDAIAAALYLWSRVTPLRFTEVPLASNPDFVIRFVAGDHGDGSPFDGVGRVLAHAFFPPPNGGAIAGDAHFDEGETWTVNIPVPAGGIDLITVAAHEFGHSLGLAHSTVAGALMFPTYTGPQRFLAQDDIDGIKSIYGVRLVESPEFDVQFYLATYPDLQAAFGTNYRAALDHWVTQGLPNEGRRGSREFDVQFYLANNPDLQAAFGTNYRAALDHWVATGITEGRRGTP